MFVAFLMVNLFRALRFQLPSRCLGNVQHGPFVMNDVQEIYQAINDYRNGRLAG